MVRKAMLNKIGKYTKQDIRELCTALSITSIEGALRNMVKVGELKGKVRGKRSIMFTSNNEEDFFIFAD